MRVHVHCWIIHRELQHIQSLFGISLQYKSFTHIQHPDRRIYKYGQNSTTEGNDENMKHKVRPELNLQTRINHAELIMFRALISIRFPAD